MLLLLLRKSSFDDAIKLAQNEEKEEAEDVK